MSVYCTRGILGGAIGIPDAMMVRQFLRITRRWPQDHVLNCCAGSGLSPVGPLCVSLIKRVEVGFVVVVFDSRPKDLQLLRATRRRIKQARQDVNG